MHPNLVTKTKEVYQEKITELYKNRKSILDNYFLSIGITKPFKHSDEEELVLSSNSLQ